MKKIFTLSVMLLIIGGAFCQKYSSDEIKPVNNLTKGLKATFLNEGFESATWPPAGWTLIDADGDSDNWRRIIAADGYPAHTGTASAVSHSYENGVGAYTPINYLITPAVDLSGVTDAVILSYWVSAHKLNWYRENYRVVVSTTTPDETGFNNGDILLNEELTITEQVAYQERVLNLSPYLGQTIYIAFIHDQPSNDQYSMEIDDVMISNPLGDNAGVSAIIAPNNDGGCTLTSAENVTITIYNYGGSAIQDFDVTYEYSFNSGAPVVITENCDISISPGTGGDYTFSSPLDMSALGEYEFLAYASLPGDIDNSNDTIYGHFVRNANAVITSHVLTEINGPGAFTWQIENSASGTIAAFVTDNNGWNVLYDVDICVWSDSCYTYTFTSTDGGIADPGYVSVDYEGVQVGGSTVPGSYDGTDLLVPAIGGGCAAVDLGLTEITTPAIFTGGLLDITGIITNLGTDQISSFDVTYTINGGPTSSTYSLSGLNIQTGNTYSFTHNSQYNFTDGNHIIEVTVSNVNAFADGNLANNTLTKEIIANSNPVPRKVLHQNFTSSTCAPCAGANPVLDGVCLDPANDDVISTLVKYQVSWPAPGDPYTTQEIADLVTEYGVTGVPTFYGDNNETSGAAYSQGELNGYAAVPAFMTIDGLHTITGNDISVDVTINPLMNLSDVVCRVAVCERVTTGNVGNNGETEFHNVMMKMLPDKDGTPVTLVNGAPTTFTVSYDMSGTFVEEMGDLIVVMWVIDLNTHEIYQSNYSVYFTSDDENKMEINSLIEIYPNPVKELLNISNVEGATILIYNIMGNVVGMVKDANNKVTYNVSSFAQGTYIIKVLSNNEVVTSKFNVIR